MKRHITYSTIKRIYTFVFTTILCCTTAFPQEDMLPAPLDSLLNLYNTRTGAEHMRAGQELLDFYAGQSVFFGEAPKITDQMSADEQDMYVWFATERYLTTVSYYKEAMPYISQALELADSHQEPYSLNSASDIHATLLCDRAYCLFKTSDYTNAIEAAQEAKRVCQETGNTMQLSRAYLYLALVNHSLRNYDEAKNQVVKAIETNDQLGLNIQTHNLLGVACELFCSAREVDQAIEYGKQAVKAARDMNLMPAVANHLTQLSYAYDRKGEYQLGLEAADEAIQIVKSAEPLDRNQLAITLEFKSWNLIDLHRNQEAVDALREAIALEEAVGNSSAVRYDYRTLAEALEPIDMHEAMAALRRCLAMTDSLHTVQLRELMTQANAELHNDELQEENQHRGRLITRILLIALLVALALTAIIVLLWQAARQRKLANQTLRRLTEARESFFTNVTHEFRTPLTVILGLSRELQSPTTTPDAAQLTDIGQTIERQGTQLLTLVGQLLDISKVKSAIGPQQEQTDDLAAYVTMIVETHRELAREKDITLRLETDEGGMPASFVPDYIHKVVSNLLANAIKFTPEGGTVEASLHRNGDSIHFSVSDNGCGISEQDLPHIFEPFYQSADARSRGTGVGLALVHQIVQALGGEIDVQSREGEGTTFYVRIPAKRRPSPSPSLVGKRGDSNTLSKAGNKDSANKDTGSKRTEHIPPLPTREGLGEGLLPAEDLLSPATLLIVEDNADVARLIARQLDGRYTIHFAANGDEGIQKAMDIIPDLIVTDLMMPGTDGLQLCRTLRDNTATNHIPVIVVTARATEADRIQGLKAGADAYLYKPFNAEELNVRIEKLLEMRQLLWHKYGADSAPIAETTKQNMNKTELNTAANQEEEAAKAAFTAASEAFIQHVRETVLRLMPQGNCDIETIAAELCITPSQMRRKMNAITGMPPKKYIMKIRMDQARRMLHQNPELKLATIAEQCGFYDHSHFIRLYKETYGTTPAADRQGG